MIAHVPYISLFADESERLHSQWNAKVPHAEQTLQTASFLIVLDLNTANCSSSYACNESQLTSFSGSCFVVIIVVVAVANLHRNYCTFISRYINFGYYFFSTVPATGLKWAQKRD